MIKKIIATVICLICLPFVILKGVWDAVVEINIDDGRE